MTLIDKKNLWATFCKWFLKHRKVILISLGAVVFVTAAVCTYLILANKTPIKTVEKTKTAVVSNIKYYSPLTGSLVANKAATKQPVTGIMIENSTEARPQSGLKNSGIVFEAIAEGGITRFLVLYQSEKPQLIGPVRSVRPYYISWAAGFDASIAHIGGSDDAMAQLATGNYRNLDQFYNADTYWRASDRWAPHNVYTSFKNLDALNAEKGYTTSAFTPFSRVDGSPVETPDATNINVEISSSLFNSSYAYNSQTNTYSRSQAGEAHQDREDGQITPAVVIAMFVDESNTGDYKNHEDIQTISTGRAVIFQNGTAIEATWAKTSETNNITFTNASGSDIPLVRGQTWIAAVPNGNGNVTWN